jgi:Holliday junction resolvasome RuvABC endonuclease subunit
MNNLQTILSLDLGTRTGWALHKDGHITSGTAHFDCHKQDGIGKRYWHFARWLEAYLRCARKIDAVYFEQVHSHKGTYAAHAYGGFLSQLTALCERYRIPYIGVPVGTIKLFISGKGNASKDDVIASVKALGHDPCDDNEADALALLHLALHKQQSRKPQLNQPIQLNQSIPHHA